jgi:hypothetical protein
VRKSLLSGLVFGVIYFIAISFSELFAYAAFWHLVPFIDLSRNLYAERGATHF